MRNRWVLNDLETFIIQRYATYDNNKDNGKIRRILYSDTEREALLSLYSNTKAFDAIRQSVITLNLTRCPYCNIEAPTTIDHFLPQSSFPEYSMKFTNLVGSCNTCNLIKSDESHDEFNNEILFNNPNIVPFPEKRYVFAKIYSSGSSWVISYTFLPHIHAGHAIGRRINNLNKKINLDKRFSELAVDEIRSIFYRVVKKDLNRRKDKIKYFFLYEKERWSETYGNNHWKVALYAAAFSSDEFIEYCACL